MTLKMPFSRRTAAKAMLMAPLLTMPRRAFAQDALEGELTIWYGPGTESDIVTNTIIPAFQTANPGVTIDVLLVPFDQLQNKYNTEASAGGGPDLLYGPSDWVGAYVDAEIVRAVDELGGEGFKEGFNPAAVDLFTRDGQMYGVPQNINGVGLFYNKQLVAEPPKTTDELVGKAAEVAGAAEGTYGLGLFPQYYNNAGYHFGFGGVALTGAGTAGSDSTPATESGEQPVSTSGFDSPETVEWLTWLQTLSTSPGVFIGADQNAIESLFREGKLGMMINGPWFTQGAAEGIGAENVGVAVLPAISAKGDAPAKPFVGGLGVYINSNIDDDQAQLAFAFASWFVREGTTTLVAQAGQIPANNSVTIPPENAAAATWQEQYANGVPIPNDPKMGAVFPAGDDMIGKVLQGQSTPQEAATSAAETVNKAS